MLKKAAVTIFFIIIAIVNHNTSYAHTKYVKIPQVGTEAPSFKISSGNVNKNFPKDYKGKWVILFSMPSCFTTVCTSEMKALMQEVNSFKNKNCEVLGLTFNCCTDQKKWISQVKGEYNIKNEIMLIPDENKKISKLYGMYHPEMAKDKAMRTVFFIDPNSRVKSVLIYPLLNGRNIVEIKRILTALQKSASDKIVTPANWEEGEVAFVCDKCIDKNVITNADD